MTYELNAIYDHAKSFYRKASVIETNNKKELLSYKTIVCTIQDGRATIHTNAHEQVFSNTTLRHIKEFLLQNSFTIGTKKELIKMYGE